MPASFFDSLAEQTEALKDQGLYKQERLIAGPQQAAIDVVSNGSTTEVINLCANNYLGLANHPKVIDAAHAALAMRHELAGSNRELEAEGLPTLSIGVGLHRGVGVAGLVGSRDLMQFAFVGRIVNLAARVQDLTRQYDVDVLVTRAVQETLDPRFVLRELPATSVRGVAKPVAIFAVEEFRQEQGAR